MTGTTPAGAPTPRLMQQQPDLLAPVRGFSGNDPLLQFFMGSGLMLPGTEAITQQQGGTGVTVPTKKLQPPARDYNAPQPHGENHISQADPVREMLAQLMGVV
jgi:hypothetical protein